MTGLGKFLAGVVARYFGAHFSNVKIHESSSFHFPFHDPYITRDNPYIILFNKKLDVTSPKSWALLMAEMVDKARTSHGRSRFRLRSHGRMGSVLSGVRVSGF